MQLSCILLQSTLIDACVLDSDSGLLQQVCYHQLHWQLWYFKLLVCPVKTYVFAGLRYYGRFVSQDSPEGCPGTIPPGKDAFTFLYLCLPPAKIRSWHWQFFCEQWVFLPDSEQRPKLMLPQPTHVDYRAACFCHRNLIEIGYVCSVCLSSKSGSLVKQANVRHLWNW